MLDVLVYLAVFVIAVIVIWWLLSQLSLPEPIGKIINIVLVVVAAVFLRLGLRAFDKRAMS